MDDPKFHECMNPLLATMRDLRVATPRIACAKTIERIGCDHNGHVIKNIQFARLYLATSGYLADPSHGLWRITEKGDAAGELSPEQIAEVRRSGSKRPKMNRADNLTVLGGVK